MVSSPTAKHTTGSRCRGFTLVEISVVVTIIGLIAAIGMPAFRRITLRSKATATISDIRTFTTAFVGYSVQHGVWPQDGSPGEIVSEMQGAISNTFAQPTPIGGMYDWDYDVSPNGFHTKAAITIVSTSAHPMTDDAELVEMIDQLMDDGDLNTGNVRLGSANTLCFIIEL